MLRTSFMPFPKKKKTTLHFNEKDGDTKFTLEIRDPISKSVPLGVMRVTRYANHNMKYWHIKPTNSGRYNHYECFHNSHVKINVLKPKHLMPLLDRSVYRLQFYCC
ncbi:hypothetical protein WA026_021901 [Henosepilachna vigintioctopunctata]|uniref:Uncharacterized protein n=1 Tax=Henosepilachna vigintioctopunctata TaxID=420089 RepID=A0AAW1UMY8_9CUCU